MHALENSPQKEFAVSFRAEDGRLDYVGARGKPSPATSLRTFSTDAN